MEKIAVLYIIIATLAIICLVLFLLWYSVYTKPNKEVAYTNAIIKQKTPLGYEAVSVDSNNQENSWLIKTTTILNPGDVVKLVVFKQ